MELIDRNALLEKAYYRGKPATVNNPWGDGAEVVDVEDIEAAPIVDATQVIHARWIKRFTCYSCSECGHQVTSADNYCPNCGAKMDLEE